MEWLHHSPPPIRDAPGHVQDFTSVKFPFVKRTSQNRYVQPELTNFLLLYLNFQYWNRNLKNTKVECYTGRIINLCHGGSYMSKTHIETSYLGHCPHSLQTVLFWLWSVYNQGHFTQCGIYHFSCMSAFIGGIFLKIHMWDIMKIGYKMKAIWLWLSTH